MCVSGELLSFRGQNVFKPVVFAINIQQFPFMLVNHWFPLFFACFSELFEILSDCLLLLFYLIWYVIELTSESCFDGSFFGCDLFDEGTGLWLDFAGDVFDVVLDLVICKARFLILFLQCAFLKIVNGCVVIDQVVSICKFVLDQMFNTLGLWNNVDSVFFLSVEELIELEFQDLAELSDNVQGRKVAIKFDMDNLIVCSGISVGFRRTWVFDRQKGV